MIITFSVKVLHGIELNLSCWIDLRMKIFGSFILLIVVDTIFCSCPDNTVPWSNGTCKPVKEAVFEATEFLKEYMPNFDQPNEATLFEGGIVIPTVNISLMARQKYPWAENISIDLFFDYVLPYASVNEARTDWRQLIWDKLTPEIDEHQFYKNTDDLNVLELVAQFVNSKIWSLLAPKDTDNIIFKSSQTPLIYDPMSTMLFGYASCTGISILYIDALRTLGIPARLVGTPAWNGNVENGNHNWVEVWLGNDESGGWKFIEGLPAGGPSETFENPCDKWFCTAAHFGGDQDTNVFAARYSESEISYPMAWDLDNTDIPGVDRTEYYHEKCRPCSARMPVINLLP